MIGAGDIEALEVETLALDDCNAVIVQDRINKRRADGVVHLRLATEAEWLMVLRAANFWQRQAQDATRAVQALTREREEAGRASMGAFDRAGRETS